MDIRPIRNQADYDAAVAEIERLWHADPGTDDGDKLDILATLVEKFENEHWPIDTSLSRRLPFENLAEFILER